ncbi:MAG TPA: AMP-binding protein [Rubrobacter sp.]|nr:AMP-binding protein [Rubrobacter sp.]
MSELRTLGSVIDVLAEHGDRQAVLALQEEGAKSWSYGELAVHVLRLAHGLTKVGVSRGDHVMLLAPGQPEWMVACLAIIGAGAVATPVDVQLGDDALSRILDHSGASFIFTTADQTEKLEHLDTILKPKHIVLDRGKEDPRSWRHLLARKDRHAELPQPDPNDPAALFYTSGTTGAPKGVPLSHANLAFQIDAILGANVVNENDHMLVPLPLHHVYPFVMGMLAPLTLGLTIVLPQSLTGPQLVRALKEGKVTVITGVPRLYSALYSGIVERARSGGKLAAALFGISAGLSTWVRRRTGLDAGKAVMRPLRERLGPGLRILASGGAPLDPDLAQKLEGMGWRIVIGYGLTETSPLLALKLPDGKKLESVGQPMHGIDVRIDPSSMPGEDTERRSERRLTSEPYQEGEILARGPGVFSGYLNLPEETEDVFTKDGWFCTRDLGYFDEDGYLYVTGRASTLIVTEGGKNIQPEVVEEAYLEDQVIREIGVLQREGRLVAVILPDLDEIRRRTAEIDRSIRHAVEEVSDRLPSYQRISEYTVTHQPLERTQLGKIRRHLLEERFDVAKKGAEGASEAVGPMPIEEMPDEDRTLLENPVAREVWELLGRRYADRYLTPDTSPQLDLGIDSLGWMDLTLEIDQSTSVELSEEAIGRIYTVRELLSEVVEQAEAGGRSVPQAMPLEHPEEILSDEQKRSLEPFGPVKATVARGMFALNKAIARKVFRLHIEGVEHLPEEGPFVLTPNHISSLDPSAIAAALDYRHLRHIYWAGRADTAFSNPLKRLVSRLGHVVPIDAHSAVFSSLAFGAAVLKRKDKLVWFPEGHRSHTGELEPFRPGIGVLLNRFPVPVVPVFIRGTFEAMPPGKVLPRPTKLMIVFGEPLDPRELEQQGEGEQPEDRIVQALYEHVMELVDARS